MGGLSQSFTTTTSTITTTVISLTIATTSTTTTISITFIITSTITTTTTTIKKQIHRVNFGDASVPVPQAYLAACVSNIVRVVGVVGVI